MAVEADPKLILNKLFLSCTKGQEIPHFSRVKSTKRLQIESRAADLGDFPCCPPKSRPSRCPAARAGGSCGPSLAAGTLTHPALPGDHGDAPAGAELGPEPPGAAAVGLHPAALELSTAASVRPGLCACHVNPVCRGRYQHLQAVG